MIFIAAPQDYLAEAKSLSEALSRYSLESYVSRYESVGSWEENTLRRVLVVHTAWRNHCLPKMDEACWLVDADLTIESDPSAFFKHYLDAFDIALAYRDDKPNLSDDFAISAGIVGWRGTAGAEFFVDWASRCLDYPSMRKRTGTTWAAPEQGCLKQAERQADQRGAIIRPIAKHYHCLPQDRHTCTSPVVISHTPASRRKKRLLGRG